MAYSNSKTPVILLAIANDDGRSLRQLDEEQRALGKSFEQACKEGKCEIKVLATAAAADVIGAFQTYRDRIKVFHYGGHSNEDKIFFKGRYQQAKEVKAESLAAFLALQTGLELIFLNSCLSLGQAEAYYKAGSKAVIATNTEIGDQGARVFAGLFYAGLTTGADISQAYRELQVQSEEKYRSIGRKKSDQENACYWQLYPKGPHSWRLPLMAQRLTRIPTIDLKKEFIGKGEDLDRLSHLLDQSSQVLLIK